MTDDDRSTLFPDIADREEVARLADAKNAARMALAEHPLTPLMDYEGNVVRCVASDIPVMVDDEYVSDEETGEIWLRAAIGLGPRGEVDEEETADESEFEPEHA